MGEIARYVLGRRFDAATSAQHQAAMLALLTPTMPNLVVDFTEVEFLSSSGLRVLLVVARQVAQFGGQLSAVDVCAAVREVIVAAGLDQVLVLA